MASNSMSAGWYPDHQDNAVDRWWDGREWTATTRPSGRSASESTTVVRPATDRYLADTTARDSQHVAAEPAIPLNALAPPAGQPVDMRASTNSAGLHIGNDEPTGWIPVVSIPVEDSWTQQQSIAPRGTDSALTTQPAGFSPPPWLLGGLVGLVVLLVGAVAFFVATGSKNSTVVADVQPSTTSTTTTTIPATTTPTVATTIPTAPPQTIIVEVPQRQTVRTVPVDPCVADPWQCEGDIVYATSAPSGAPSSFDNDSAHSLATGWIVQFASFDASDPSASSAADNSVAALRAAGEDAFVLWSGDFGALTDGYWVVVNNLSFNSGEDAAGHCRAIGRYNKDDCLGRYLSFDSDDRKMMVVP
ncbi:unannotated protein [freshwater metagenome]|uniref:Unannotated protein n=1 Tax=freshwater metagenome TaxID=449393 RepID=A0A6J7SAJ5_9ZZZZ|nr:DUF2510 domain-containing protein [Actinomycetota bacterium]